MTALDPDRSYSAAEVQSLFDRREIEEIREDLNGVVQVTRDTAHNVAELTKEVSALALAVKGHVELPSHPGTATQLSELESEMRVWDTMSMTERQALPGTVRSYIAGVERSQKRERQWRNLAAVATSVAVLISILSALGVFTAIRVAVFHVT